MSEIVSASSSVSIEKAPYNPDLFRHISQFAMANYEAHVVEGTPVFRVMLKKGDLFDAYLAGLPEQYRQQMNCSCCRGFLNRFGGMVRLSAEPETFGKPESVFWRDSTENDMPSDEQPIFKASIDAMRALVEGAAIERHFLSSAQTLGTFELGGFEHFAVRNRQIFIHGTKEAHEIIADEVQSHSNMSKFIGETDAKLINSVLTYFQHDAQLKAQEKWLGHMEWLAGFKKQRDALPQEQRRAWIWLNVATQSPGRVDIKNSPLGTFIKNVKGGDSYEVAKAKFLKMVDGINYMRPTAAPKAGNIARAETIFEKMELAPSLERRFLTHEELRGKVWVPPTAAAAEPKKELFGHLKPRDAKPTTPDLPKINGGNITLQKFLQDVLPKAKELQFAGSDMQGYQIAGYTTAVHADAKPILMWDKPEARNPVCGYVYHNGSPLQQWGLSANSDKVKIAAIITSPEHWNEDLTSQTPEQLVGLGLTFVLNGGCDRNIQATPMFPETFRTELHEVRSVLESFFRTKRLTPLEPSQQAVVGIRASSAGAMHIPLLVTQEDAVVHYVIDRAN